MYVGYTMGCSEQTREAILQNGDSDMLSMVDFLIHLSSEVEFIYQFGFAIEKAIFYTLISGDAQEWEFFKLPMDLYLPRPDRDLPMDLLCEVELQWMEAQPELLRVYFECNEIIRRIPEESGAVNLQNRDHFWCAAKMFRDAVRPPGWTSLMDKCEYGRKRIAPPGGYAWVESTYKKGR